MYIVFDMDEIYKVDDLSDAPDTVKIVDTEMSLYYDGTKWVNIPTLKEMLKSKR